MPSQVNSPISQAENIFKILVWDTVIKAEIGAFKASNAWAAIWPVSAIIDAIVSLIGNKIFTAGRLLIDVTAIRFLDEKAQAAYHTAAVNLAVIAHDKGIESNEFKIARENAKAALSNFTRFHQ